MAVALTWWLVASGLAGRLVRPRPGPRPTTPDPGPSVILPKGVLTNPAELAGSYQGLMKRTDGTDQWLRLAIFNVTPDREGARFRFNINSRSDRLKGEGTLSLRDNTVSLRDTERYFAEIHGVLEVRSDGYLLLHSAATNIRPNWSFTSNRSLSTREGPQE